MSNRANVLVKNTLLFAIGNIGSKLIQIMLVPYYTRVMTDVEYGTTDILQAIVSLLLPIVSLTIYESVFRYSMDDEYDKVAVLSSGVFVSTIGAVLLCFVALLIQIINPIQYVWLIVINSIATSFRSLFSQYARAINRVTLFTIDNILLTVYILVLNIIFLSFLKMGITGYMLGYILANVISLLFLYIKLGNERKINLRLIKKPVLKELLLYSVPLIPNAICWWLSNFFDRIMITTMVSVAVNGLYAVAHKVPSLLSMFVAIFFQAWQISANTEFKKQDISEFYSKIFEQLFVTIVLVSSVLIIFCRPITDIFMGEEYYSSWKFMPYLLLSMTFFSFAQFLGSIYSANKKTGMAFITNLIAMIVNVSLNFILISSIGALGASIASASSYFILWVIRVINTRKIVPLKYKTVQIYVTIFILLMQALLVTNISNGYGVYLINIGLWLFLIIIFKNTIKEIVNFFLGILKRMKR
ncbi:MAG: oligosaccharide flippase family protein [Ruminococcaceae bacterium]|nr:oligosaccharide flippase family protein [Oscillospiraceae bacterium]